MRLVTWSHEGVVSWDTKVSLLKSTDRLASKGEVMTICKFHRIELVRK